MKPDKPYFWCGVRTLHDDEVSATADTAEGAVEQFRTRCLDDAAALLMIRRGGNLHATVYYVHEEYDGSESEPETVWKFENVVQFTLPR